VTGTYRHGRTYCQVSGCQARVRRATEIELPMAWELDQEYTTLTVLVGVCPRHGQEIDRRVQAMLSARAALPALLTVIEGAIQTEEDQHRRLCELEATVRRIRTRSQTALQTWTARPAGGEPGVPAGHGIFVEGCEEDGWLLADLGKEQAATIAHLHNLVIDHLETVVFDDGEGPA
jgi:hypothetical protein